MATQASCRASCLNGGIKVWDRVEIPIRRGGWPYMRFVPGRMVQLARSGWGTDSFGGTVGLVGNNLLNENIRNSVSYNKDEVLMQGIGVRAFANLKF